MRKEVESVSANTDLDKNFEVQTKLFTESENYLSQELVAQTDMIKIVNDDDVLGLFKKNLQGENRFVQIQVSETAIKVHALGIINSALEFVVARDAISCTDCDLG